MPSQIDQTATIGLAKRTAAANWFTAGVTFSTVGLTPGEANIAPMNGIMSTTISLPTLSGWRAASIRPMVPPIEWPTTAGLGRLFSRI